MLNDMNQNLLRWVTVVIVMPNVEFYWKSLVSLVFSWWSSRCIEWSSSSDADFILSALVWCYLPSFLLRAMLNLVFMTSCSYPFVLSIRPAHYTCHSLNVSSCPAYFIMLPSLLYFVFVAPNSDPYVTVLCLLGICVCCLSCSLPMYHPNCLQRCLHRVFFVSKN